MGRTSTPTTEIASHDERAEASVLSLLEAFDNVEHALRRFGARDTMRPSTAARSSALDEAVMRAGTAMRAGTLTGESTDDDLLGQLRVFTAALREMTPAILPGQANFRPALRG